MTLIEKLRVMLNTLELSHHDYTTLCEAIRALGGNPGKAEQSGLRPDRHTRSELANMSAQ